MKAKYTLVIRDKNNELSGVGLYYKLSIAREMAKTITKVEYIMRIKDCKHFTL
jgi:hypothetical protein